MRSRSKKHNKAKSEQIVDRIVYFLIIAYVAYSLLPAFSKIRSTFSAGIVEKIIITAIICYYSWFRKNKSPLNIRIVTTILGVLFFWIPLFISSNRTLCLILTGLLLVAVCILIYTLIRDIANMCSLLYIEVIFYTFGALSFSEFTEETTKNAFVFIPIIISIVFTAIATIGSWHIFKRRNPPTAKVKKSHKKPAEFVVWVAFCSLIFSWLISYITIDNLNYALDASKPTTHLCEITDKSYKIGRRHQRGYHCFKVEIDGENFWIDVTSSQFDYYSVGDDFAVNLHSGFLDEPYLISRDID